MFDFVLLGSSLVPLGLLLFFWKVFPRDSGIHPVYRDSRIETRDEGPEVQDPAARTTPMREVERNDKVA